jgi:hypothetical protein
MPQFEKMQKMRLNGMKRAMNPFETEPRLFTNDEFIAWLIESEDNQRNNSRTERLLKMPASITVSNP